MPGQTLYQNGGLSLLYTAAIYNSYIKNAQTLLDWRPLYTHYIVADGICTHGDFSLLYTAAMYNSYCQDTCPIIMRAFHC